MKPANFPQRKQERRIRALKRGLTGSIAKERTAELVAIGNQRAVRTKKDRTARAKFHRSAQ